MGFYRSIGVLSVWLGARLRSSTGETQVPRRKGRRPATRFPSSETPKYYSMTPQER